MKFLTIDLLAYGHFAKRSLVLPAGGPNLHIIYGPNEAGKSTTLRAITAFLYGMDRSGVDAHRFEGSELRVGADVLHSDGRRRYFVRRRSGAGSLADADGNVLDESQLGDWLSVRDRKLFEAMFGLSHVQLRSAGEALATSKNAAAEALFGAVLEGASLRATLTHLQEEAEALLTPAGRAGELVKAVRGYRELHEADRKARGSINKWTQLQEEIQKAEEMVRGLNDQLRAARVEVGRLERIRRTLPLLQQRAKALELRAAIRAERLLDAGIGERRRGLLREQDEARVVVDDLTSKLDRARRDRAALEVPDALVAFAPRVKALNEALGTYRKALNDRPGLVQGILPLRREAEEVLRELGRPDMPLDDVESLRVLLPEQERIRTLQREGVALEVRLAQIGTQAAEAEAERARRAEALAGLASPRDVTVLRAVWERNAADHGVDRALREADAAHDRVALEVAACASALGVDPDGAGRLVRAPIPSAEAIQAAEVEEDAIRREGALAAERRHQVAEDLESATRALSEFAAGRPIPSAELLREVRDRRDDVWEEVRRAWSSGAPATIAGGGGMHAVPLVESFSVAMRDADGVADALWRDSERVAQYALLHRACEEHRARAQGLERQADAHTAREAQRVAGWKERWAAAGIDPGSSREMAAWRSRWEAFVAVTGRRDEAAATCNRTRERVTELRCALTTALDLAGVRCSEAMPWSALRALVEGALAEASEAALRAASARGEVERLDAAVVRVHAQRAVEESRLEVWRGKWADATAKVWPQGALEPEAVPHVLDSLNHLFKVMDDRERLEKRIHAINKDVTRFEHDLDERLGQAGVVLEGLPIDRAEVLIHRAEAAVRASQRRDDLDEQIGRLEVEIDGARARHERADFSLRRLVEEAECEGLEALEEMERRSTAARSFDEQRAEAERRLLEIGEGWSLQDLEAAAEGMDSDRLRAALEALEADVLAKEEARATAQTNLGEIRGRKRQFSAGDEAATQLQAAQSQAEKARSLAARCARLHVASAMLQRAMARYQEESQSVVLRRAEALFSKLTRGRYTGLRVEYDGDVATIRCVRDGEAVQVKDRVMSDGTLDQLYLALRLASIEQHLSSQEPIPLVLDDIFIHFDDERAQAGIEVLAEFAEKTQVLLLTHHARNMELARKALPVGSWSELHLERPM